MFALTSYHSASCLAHTCCSHCDEFLSEWITPEGSVFHPFKHWTLAYLFRLWNAQFEVLSIDMTKEFLGMTDHFHPRVSGSLANVCVLVAQSCLTLLRPMNCSPPGSSVHGNSPNKNTGLGYHALLHGIFPTQRLNPGLPHCRRILDRLSHQGSPRILE